MKADKNRIEELAAGYWSATLTQSEEQELRAAVATFDGDDEQIEALKIMLGGFEQLSHEYSAESTPPRRAKIFKLVASFTAAAAVIALCLTTFINTESVPETDIYCYINGEPITDIEVALEQTKYFKQLETLSQTMEKFESILN